MNATVRQYLIDTPTMDAAEIRELNRYLVELLGLSNGDDVTESVPGAIEAVGTVAARARLILLHTSWDGDRESTRLYVGPRGTLVNAWVSGDALGFDDQLESHEGQP